MVGGVERVQAMDCDNARADYMSVRSSDFSAEPTRSQRSQAERWLLGMHRNTARISLLQTAVGKSDHSREESVLLEQRCRGRRKSDGHSRAVGTRLKLDQADDCVLGGVHSRRHQPCKPIAK